jgi:hypothetical protein
VLGVFPREFQEGILMKKVLWIAMLALALPMAAFASSGVDFTNSGGTLSGSSGGLTLSGSELIAVNGLNGLGLVTGALGSVSFWTGALLTGGNLQQGGTFAGGAASGFVIDGSGLNGIPSGAIFTGSFDGPVTWTLVTLANGTHNYTLQGSITGTWYNGATVYGATIQLTINTGKGFFNGSTTISSGDTSIGPSPVPEPSSLIFMGTGLIAVAGLLRRKLKV